MFGVCIFEPWNPTSLQPRSSTTKKRMCGGEVALCTRATGRSTAIKLIKRHSAITPLDTMLNAQDRCPEWGNLKFKNWNEMHSLPCCYACAVCYDIGGVTAVDHGCFPFTKRFRKFQLGCKWNMIFRFVPLENFRKKWNFWKGSPVFPLEIFRWNCVFHLRVSQRFTSSRPLITISSARKYGGYSFRWLGGFRLLRFLRMLSLSWPGSWFRNLETLPLACTSRPELQRSLESSWSGL